MQVLEAIKKCYASLYTDRAISYRCLQGFAHEDVALSVGIQRMVRSDLASAGVLFTLDTDTGFPDVVVVNASYGLGESVVQVIMRVIRSGLGLGLYQIYYYDDDNYQLR